MAILILKLCFLHLCWIDFEYTNILSYPSLQKSLEEQMKGEVKKYGEDLRIYRTEKQQLKKELEALKVSVAYMHTTVQYYHISWFVACHRTICMEIASLSSYSGIHFKMVVIINHSQLTALNLLVAVSYVSLDDSQVIFSLVHTRTIFIVILTFKFLKCWSSFHIIKFSLLYGIIRRLMERSWK